MKNKKITKIKKIIFYLHSRRADENNSSDGSTHQETQETKGNNNAYRTTSSMEKHSAWEEKKELDSVSKTELDYTYENCAFLMDRVFFVIFIVINIVVTIACITTLTTSN